MQAQNMAVHNASEAERVGMLWLDTRLATAKSLRQYKALRRMAADRALEWKRELSRRQDKESPPALISHAATNMAHWEQQAACWDHAIEILKGYLRKARP